MSSQIARRLVSHVRGPCRFIEEFPSAFGGRCQTTWLPHCSWGTYKEQTRSYSAQLVSGDPEPQHDDVCKNHRTRDYIARQRLNALDAWRIPSASVSSLAGSSAEIEKVACSSASRLPGLQSLRPASLRSSPVSSALGMPRQLPIAAGVRDIPVHASRILGSIRFMTRNIRGRMFYKRRPKQVPRWKFNWRSKWLEGNPMKKGVCTKVMVTRPKKPNSGLRKTAYVRLSNGRVVMVYIPGIGHNLQVHSVVLVRGGRKRDVIGCNLTAMRGHYDLLPVKNRKSSRSKYGVSKPQETPRMKRFQRLTTSIDRRLYYYRTGNMVGPDEADDPEKGVKHRIPYIVRNNPPVTYRPRGGKKKK